MAGGGSLVFSFSVCRCSSEVSIVSPKPQTTRQRILGARLNSSNSCWTPCTILVCVPCLFQEGLALLAPTADSAPTTQAGARVWEQSILVIPFCRPSSLTQLASWRSVSLFRSLPSGRGDDTMRTRRSLRHEATVLVFAGTNENACFDKRGSTRHCLLSPSKLPSVWPDPARQW